MGLDGTRSSRYASTMATRRLPRPVYLAIGYLLTSRPFTVWHRWTYRRSAGRGILARALGMDMLLVTVRGRRSGAWRTVPLGAVRHGDDWIVVGSNAGKPREPDWAHNLRATTETVTVEHRGRVAAFRVHEAGPDEAETLWPIVIDGYPGYDVYRRRTARPIALFVLEPVAVD
jgi:deazaflavin-dependent oxidoreductase (nitroreductase family)